LAAVSNGLSDLVSNGHLLHHKTAREAEHTLIAEIMLRQFLSRPLLSGPISLIGRSEQFSVQKVLKLNDLRHAEGAVKKVS
jgi:hypothetical protein